MERRSGSSFYMPTDVSVRFVPSSTTQYAPGIQEGSHSNLYVAEKANGVFLRKRLLEIDRHDSLVGSRSLPSAKLTALRAFRLPMTPPRGRGAAFNFLSTS
jgi:hypothetical protein